MCNTASDSISAHGHGRRRVAHLRVNVSDEPRDAAVA